MSLLETNQLTKKYRKVTALNKLDLVIEPGMVFGLLGPNGSGKTTTLGLLLDVLKPTSGTYSWFGEAPSPAIRKKIGAILEIPCFYPYMSGQQNLNIVAKIRECPLDAIDQSLEVVGLLERKNDPFGTYSLGMKQRLAIASALLADPAVLILDEPTNGLDPQGIVEIREIIRKIATTGKTIILASHLLDEVQKVCTHFMVLQKGKKLFQGSVQEALANEKKIEVSASDMERLKDCLESFVGIEHLEQQVDKLILKPKPGITPEAVNRYLVEQELILTHLVETSGNLEKEFLRILADHD